MPIIPLTQYRRETTVFVYGTLMRGERNHPLLQRARFIGAAKTGPFFELVSLGWCPAMIPGGTTEVMGELYAVDSETLSDLDRLENHPDWYTRTLIRLSDGSEVQTYVMPREEVRSRPRILSGDWRQRPREAEGAGPPNSDAAG